MSSGEIESGSLLIRSVTTCLSKCMIPVEVAEIYKAAEYV